jgi:hypothetical protein
MNEIEALATMKRQCKILSKVMQDDELIGFLNDHKIDDIPPDPLPDPYIATATYNIRRSIYEALGSAITVLDQSFSRGGVSSTKVDLLALRKEFRPRVVTAIVRD